MDMSLNKALHTTIIECPAPFPLVVANYFPPPPLIASTSLSLSPSWASQPTTTTTHHSIPYPHCSPLSLFTSTPFPPIFLRVLVIANSLTPGQQLVLHFFLHIKIPFFLFLTSSSLRTIKF